jgi:hypothetical protein
MIQKLFIQVNPLMDEKVFAHWSKEEYAVIEKLNNPLEIQLFLDSVAYPATERNRSPINVIRDRQGHCLDGALFAAAALRRLGYPPVLVDMLPEPGMDDDHVLAIFRRHGHFGAVAKSNFVGLRYREAVYRSVRELVMSYFDVFYNVDGMKTMRAYALPLHLEKLDDTGWMWADAGADAIEKKLKTLRQYPVITKEIAADLSKTDELTYRAGMLVVNKDGLYKPKATYP